METITAAQVLALLDGAPSNAVVAFDCDGTLWSGDVGEDWFVELVERAGFHERAARAMREDARAHEIKSDGTDREVAQALLDAMSRGAYEEKRLYEMMAWAGAGRTPLEVDAILDEMLARIELGKRLHNETIAVLDGAISRGLRIVAVSASPLAVIQKCLAHLDIAPFAVCAATQAMDDRGLAPALSAPLPYREGKVRALREAVGDAPIAAALGDSGFDLEMLALARVPLAVRPKKGLRDRAVELATLRVLEPR